MDRQKNIGMEVRAYEEQIDHLQQKLANSKKIVSEEQEKIRNAKKELLVLWKMEINAAVSKKKENLGLPMPGASNRQNRVRRKSNGIKKTKENTKTESMLVPRNKRHESTSKHI